MDYAIGDIHGCLDKIKRLIDKLNYDPSADRLIFLGDYIDRGPASKGVIDLMIDLKHGNASNIFLMGNHEDNFLTYIQACDSHMASNYWLKEPFFAGGGVATLQSYMPNLQDPYAVRPINAVPPEHLSFLIDLQLYWTDKDFIAVHAGVRPGVPLQQQCENDLLRIRAPFLRNAHGLGKCVVFGHTPFPTPLCHQDKIGIDTGACYEAIGYGKLTAFCLQTRQTFQVV